MDIPPDSERFDQALKTFRQLVAFRRQHEDTFIDDFAYTASMERRYWNLPPLQERVP